MFELFQAQIPRIITTEVKIEVTKIIEIKEGIEANHMISPVTTLEIIEDNVAIERGKMTNLKIKDDVIKNSEMVMDNKVAIMTTAGSSAKYVMGKAMTG